ncbi:hypothetical protein A674_00598 [Salmonella enterica subsp. enterica serovar Enteritidis str. 2009K1651]|uniref:Uncharacterized protein n=1 Tax=Salmonella enterica subsp. enterica serovar Dublin str. UC16 TaxID=1192688 RepID=M7RGJ8_SALDU|nr:hypothetical protein A670_02137 [Salmonella enterica subsp. enterica serovar Dublin str. UC16]EPI90017.1 hypothetical protein A674_00598 [Salmonella enterica subsp. enterica serovar Enteritidis str. 2009K1651]EPJ07296.1 hypothetical protein A678_00799 [Salmonella enterica subsp. enterica serovar Enteritidis str. 2010K-0271]
MLTLLQATVSPDRKWPASLLLFIAGWRVALTGHNCRRQTRP